MGKSSGPAALANGNVAMSFKPVKCEGCETFCSSCIREQYERQLKLEALHDCEDIEDIKYWLENYAFDDS